MIYPKIVLRKKKDTAVKRFHPWVFSGAVWDKDKGIKDGDVVEIYSAKEECLGMAHYQDGGSIIARMISFEKEAIDGSFWKKRFTQAYQVREKLGIIGDKNTNAYRLIHAEGDGLSGLIIDIYGDTAVIQCHTIGMHLQRQVIAEALAVLYEDKLSIFDKSKETLPKKYAKAVTNGYLKGDSSSNFILENGNQFYVNWEEGQKTGFFLDQRDNRKLLATFSKGKTVLNTFCYSGGFSVYALQAGATLVHSVDASKKAIEWTDKNVALHAATGVHQSFASDTLKFFNESSQQYDIVVVDPPAYAKSVKARHNAVQGYKRLNAKAIQSVKKGGLMFTFSCSQVVHQQLFENTIVAAALETRRNIRILHRLTQPADHPTNIYHPEGSYLKGLVLYVE